MTVYLGIGAVRIQTWLAHTPKLTHLRGASQALREHTANARIEDWLKKTGTGASVVKEAGDVDGVVALKLQGAVDPAAVAGRVVADLHHRLPGVQWAAWWCEAENYLKAMWRSTDPDDPMPRLELLPRLQDNPVAESCHDCRREPLTVDNSSTSGSGADCTARDRAQQAQMAAAQQSGGRWAGIPGAGPADFDTLADKGGLADETQGPQAVGRRDSRSHLAKIAADGNGIGVLVSAITQCHVPLDGLYADTVKVINEVMENSVVAAAQEAGDPAALIKVVIPHYVGGDDCLVSIPAAAAWVFAAKLAMHFDEARRELLTRLDADVAEATANHPGAAETTADVRARISALSLGVGMVFANSSHPFSETAAMAHRALDRAKRDASGRSARIGWADLTAESGALGREYDAISTIDVATVLRQLVPDAGGVGTDVFALSPSARSQLGSILRDTRVTDPEDQQKRIQRWAKRTNSTLTTTGVDLPATLSRARWWPETNMEENDR